MSIVQILVIAAPSAVWLIGHHISPQQVQYRKNAEGRLLIRQRKNYFLQIGPLQFQQAVAREGGLSRLTCHAGPANAVACPLTSFTPAYDRGSPPLLHLAGRRWKPRAKAVSSSVGTGRAPRVGTACVSPCRSRWSPYH